MMSQQSGSRFGQDSPARIAVSTGYLVEATERLPGEPYYQPLVPFNPAITSGNGNGNGLTLENGRKVWTQYPSWCDTTFYQGDDVVIPLYFQDPNDPTLDMSNAAGWEWYAQIRTTRSYESDLIHDFVTTAIYVDGTPPAYTMVELFLPRMDNTVSGIYYWELYSIGPSDLSRFLKPDGVPPAEWPPPDVLRTWLWGRAFILPRGTTTDYLPIDAGSDGGGGVITSGGWFVGPNGRVP